MGQTTQKLLRIGLRTISIVALLLFSPATDAFDAQSAAQSVEKRYQTLQSLSASFEQTSTQTDFLGQLREVKRKGSVWIARPGKVRWEYGAPDPLTYVSDGKRLWTYRASSKEVYISTWDPNSLALQFLLGEGNLTRDFDVSTLPEAKQSEWKLTNGPWLHLQSRSDPKHPDKDHVEMALRIDKDFLVRDVFMIDPLGTRSHWAFENLKTNPTISPKTFSFSIPKGARVYGS